MLLNRFVHAPALPIELPMIGSATYSIDCIAPVVTAAATNASSLLAIPFDLTSEAYAWAVQVGLIERSMLASANFASNLSVLEKLTLGPWARCV